MLKKVQEKETHYLRPMVTAELQLCMYHHCKGKTFNTENGPSWSKFYDSMIYILSPDRACRIVDTQKNVEWMNEWPGLALSELLLLLFSHPVISDSLQPHELQHTRPPCPSPSPRFAQVLIHCIDDAIQPSHPLMPSSALNLSQHQGLFHWVSCSYQMTKIWSFSFSVSPSNEYSGLISLQIDWLISL